MSCMRRAVQLRLARLAEPSARTKPSPGVQVHQAYIYMNSSTYPVVSSVPRHQLPVPGRSRQGLEEGEGRRTMGLALLIVCVHADFFCAGVLEQQYTGSIFNVLKSSSASSIRSNILATLPVYCCDWRCHNVLFRRRVVRDSKVKFEAQNTHRCNYLTED